MLSHENLGGVLLNAQHNFAWITGGASNGIDLSRENGAAFVFVRSDGKRFLLANNIEMPRILSEEVLAKDFEPVEYSWQEEKASNNFVIEQAKLLNGGEIASDIAIHSGTRVVERLIANCRYELLPAEVERYRKLGNDAGKAFRGSIDKLKPGESEIEIAVKLRTELAAMNVNSVVTLVVADERIAKYRHPVPTENRWSKTLLLVTCAKRHGLIVSLSRIVCIGAVPDELQHKTEAAAFVNAKLLSATKPGATGAELYAIAANAYSERGFADEIDRHHQGGAAGYKTRDWAAHPKSNEVVRLNQAFAWNPSITGTKVEETVIVTENGVDTITTSKDFPMIASIVDGREYHSPGILQI